MEINKPMPSSFWDQLVCDALGKTHTLHSLVGGRACIFVFIRHFACIGCSENIAELAPHLLSLREWGISVCIIGNGPHTYIEPFQVRYSLSHSHVTIVTEPSLQIHRLLGFRRSWWSLLYPRSLFDLARAFSRGHIQTSFEGDARQQGGSLLLDKDGQLHFFHRNRSTGGHASPQHWLQAALALQIQKEPTLSPGNLV